MVSRKRRAAGLKARQTFLAKPAPGFGQRLWIDGDPRSKHKKVWKKLEAKVKRNLERNPQWQAIVKRGKELEKSDREFFKQLRERTEAEERRKQQELQNVKNEEAADVEEPGVKKEPDIKDEPSVKQEVHVKEEFNEANG
ncbi:hypothetical protein H072_631 [Dactylellina haptotyla CBS 200.50]|uniref:Uncharacterized protein n=1 Tax=Dactylellina haptotyla (strain CBS 200.50) TaxID=1284197 RepID=S8AQZ2_DACHA|nr:hypothetical protein H072_631 [Dactylellina haptotyla CBS 200.50]